MEGAALAEARLSEGEAHLESGRYAAAEQCLLEAYRVYKSAVGANWLEMSGRAIGTLGMVYQEMGRLEEAVNAYKESLRIYRKIEGKRGPNSGNILINIGNALMMQGKFPDALQVFEEARSITIQNVGPTHTDMGGVLTGLGNVCRTLGQRGQALEHFKQALLIARQSSDPSAPDHVAVVLVNVAGIQGLLGDLDEAGSNLSEALDIFRSIGKQQHPDFAAALHSQGGVLQRLGKLEDALKKYKEALKIRRQVLGDNHEAVATSLQQVAIIHSDQGRLQQGLAMFEEALGISIRALGPDHPKVAETHFLVAISFLKLGNEKGALPHARESVRIYKIHGISHGVALDAAALLNDLELRSRSGLTQPTIGSRCSLSTQQTKDQFLPGCHLPTHDGLERRLS